jgi:hypothetical protein
MLISNGLLLLHVPPPMVLPSAMDEPMQTPVPMPVMAGGVVLMVTMAVADAPDVV